MWDEITIEPNETCEWSVYGHGIYPESSVLGGQPRRTFLDSYPTLQEAQAAYPNATTCNRTTKMPYVPLPDCAPDWFDPDAAGETL